jgi:hypothetical protein
MENKTSTIDYEKMCDNLVGYYKFERQTHDTIFALECIVECYERIGNQPELLAVAKKRLVQ